MLNRNHIIPVLLPYVRSLLSLIFLETFLVLCIACKLGILERAELSPGTAITTRLVATTHKAETDPAGYWPLVLCLTLAALWMHFVILLPGTGDVFFDHAIGCNATTTLFVGLHFLVAERKVTPSSASTNSAPRVSQDTGKGIKSWTTCLSKAYALRMAPRRGHSPAQKATTTNRRLFLLERTFHLLGNFVLLDLLNTIAIRIHLFQPTCSGGPRPFRLEELPLSLLHGGMIYAGLNIMYDGYSLLSVSAGSTNPEEWPSLFGDIRDAWTVQRAWSRVWHQLMRNYQQHLSHISAYILRALPRRLVRNADIKKFIQMILAFTLSGLLHLAGEYHSLHSLHVHIPYNEASISPQHPALRLGGVMTTFALQPVGIGLEHLVFLATRRHFKSLALSPKQQSRMTCLTRCTGYAWVLAWYSFSMSFYTRSMMGAGFMTSAANIPRSWAVEAVRFVVCTVRGMSMV